MMDEDLKGICFVACAILIIVLAIIVPNNLRWRANIRDYTQNEYIQKRVPSGYTTIWVKDPNN